MFIFISLLILTDRWPERETVTVKIVKEGERQRYFSRISYDLFKDTYRQMARERERERERKKERARKSKERMLYTGVSIHLFNDTYRQMDREGRSQTGERSKVIEEREKASQ